jgi:hypothetical protein
MIYLLFLAGSIALFAGFLGLTIVEARSGTRVLGSARKMLDHRVGHMSFIAKHVNWGDFIAHLVQSIGARIAHDIAHWSLIAVRFVERQLTRIVRYLRDRSPNVLAPKPSRTPAVTQAKNYVQDMIRRPAKPKATKHFQGSEVEE